MCFSRGLLFFKNSIEISFDVIEVNFIITAQPAPLTRNKRQLTEDGWMDGYYIFIFMPPKLSWFCPSVNFLSFYLLRQWASCCG